MSTSAFNRPGAIDLSQLAKGSSPAGGGAAGPAGAASYVVEVDERTFDQTVVRASLQYPVIVEFHSPRAQGSEQLSTTLAQLASEYAGKILLARCNVDTAPRIVQLLQQQGALQAVPTVIGVIGGQLAPLFQGVLPKEQARSYIDELVKAAVANGIVGRAEPVGGAAAEEEEPDPNGRFAAADAALEEGDFGTARTEFEKLIAAAPGDAEAKAGLAQVGLLERVSALDPAAVQAAAAAPDAPLAAQLDAADLALVGGDAEGAFGRLIALVRDTAGEERETVKARLLELFETLGNADPRVKKARTQLMSALF